MGENTIGACGKRLMPCGSVGTSYFSQEDLWDILPRSPIDAFAVMATLVELSGAYRHVISPSDSSSVPYEDRFELAAITNEKWTSIARAWGAGLHPAMDRTSDEWVAWLKSAGDQYPEKSKSEREKYRNAFGRTYFAFDQLLEIDLSPLQELWTSVIVKNSKSELVSAEDYAEWWKPAINLMVLADMACSGVGFWPRVRSGEFSKATTIQQLVLDMAAKAADSPEQNQGMLTTLTTPLVDSSFCAVLPKTRTSAVGCTLRSMTHNLALLPPAGLVEARWRIPGEASFQPEMTDGSNIDERHTKPLNILLVPFPYRFGSECFEPDSPALGATVRDTWSYFHLRQLWLDRKANRDGGDRNSPNDILKFIRSLVDRAKADMKEIHAVVFPEYSLDKSVFDIISKSLLTEEGGLEFIVAGLSEEPNSGGMQATPKRGNFVAVRGRHGSAGAEDWNGNLAREKHHRWKLDARQIERYGISKSLNPSNNWWEGIPLGRRVIDFFVPRAGTAMTVLICEDLARADPVQTVVRSIGPNLVLALLMDGPQRRARWPGHYAGVLADDPGCSVLTFTSMALIARGMTSDGDQSRSVAFFKNSLGVERELFLPQGSHALALRLTTRAKVEHSLDGRSDGGAAYIWELREVTPVRGVEDDSTRWIVEGST